VVQEIDVPTGLVLFQWDSLDHVPLTSSYASVPHSSHQPYDYFHANSIALDDDGSLLISARNTWAAYKVSHQTGATIWALGGKHSSFKLAPGTYWAFQHDVRPRAQGDRYITLFDDDAGPPQIHGQSRGIKLQLDTKKMTAKQVTDYKPSPSVSTNFEGNVQQLSNGDEFVGWGQQPWLTEYSSSGKVMFNARFVAGTPSYRAYRFTWSGNPWTTPAVAASRNGSKVTVYASWNGATHIRSWRVLAGSSPSSLRTVATRAKNGFETAITIAAQDYVQVEPLDWSGHVMSKSAAIKS
jgi:arylsulfotransferase ASST